MAKMMEALMNLAPVTTEKFLSDLLYKHGMNIAEFETRSLITRYSFISKYFGYSAFVNEMLPEEIIKQEIKRLFSEYEDLTAGKEPPRDPLKVFAEKSNEEKTVIFESQKVALLKSLSDALVKNTRFKLLSLKDALVPRQRTRLEQIIAQRIADEAMEEEFWKSAIRNFDPNIIVPF